MPTGYTAPVQDGKITSAAEFLRNCIPAFDMPSGRGGAPIAPIAPDTKYHDDAIASARARLREVKAWTDDDAARQAEAAYQRDVRRMADTAAKRLEVQARYEAVLAGVRAWAPPTPLHEEFHAFAIKQLVDSIEWDCSMSHWPEPQRRTGEEWRVECIADAERDIEYHTQEREKAIERTEQRNAWLTAILDTLPQEAHSAG